MPFFSEVFDHLLRCSPGSRMTRVILERVFSPEKLDAVFQRNADRQFCRDLYFSLVVQLMMPVTLRIRNSLHSAYRSLLEPAVVTLKAVYDKVNRMEPGVSAAFVRETAAELRQYILAMRGGIPPLVAGL
jgi:hypothetical protein